MQALVLESRVGPVLVPVSMVAQIIGTVNSQPSQFQQKWIYGDFRWRDFLLPLVNSAGALGAEVEEDEQYERSVVLWPMKGGKPTEFFALTSLGPPKVIDITSQSVPDKAEIKQRLENLLGYVWLEDGIGIIPDLKTLAREIFGSG